MGGPVDRSEAARARAPHSHRGRVSVVVFVILIIVIDGGVGGGSGITTTRRCRGHAACRAGGAHCDDDEEVGERTTAGAGNGDESRGSARADNNQPKIGSKDAQNISWSVKYVEHHQGVQRLKLRQRLWRKEQGAGGSGSRPQRQWQ